MRGCETLTATIREFLLDNQFVYVPIVLILE